MLLGRGQHSHAYTHSVQVGHRVWLNLETLKFYCLPDNYQIIDPSLEDIKVSHRLMLKEGGREGGRKEGRKEEGEDGREEGKKEGRGRERVGGRKERRKEGGGRGWEGGRKEGRKREGEGGREERKEEGRKRVGEGGREKERRMCEMRKESGMGEDVLMLCLQFVLKPVFTKEAVANLDRTSKLSLALDGSKYLPGIVGLNNIKVREGGW